MKMTITKSELSKNDFSMLIEVTATMKDLESDLAYGRRGVTEMVQHMVAEKITEKILEDKWDEITDMIDMDKIIKRCEFEIVRRKTT